MDCNYARAYRRLYFEHWWWKSREEYLIGVLDCLDLPVNPIILDVGCGDGLFFDRLAQYSSCIEGIEPNVELVSDATSQRFTVHTVPFDSAFAAKKQYDLVLMLDVLEHLADPASALNRAASIVSSRGYVVVTVPAFRCLWTSHDVINHHLARYTKNTMEQLFLQTDLLISRKCYFFHWLLLVKLLIRIKEYCCGQEARFPKVPRSFVNTILLTLSRMEHRIFRTWPLPFGSSLLVIAERKR